MRFGWVVALGLWAFPWMGGIPVVSAGTIEDSIDQALACVEGEAECPANKSEVEILDWAIDVLRRAYNDGERTTEFLGRIAVGYVKSGKEDQAKEVIAEYSERGGDPSKYPGMFRYIVQPNKKPERASSKPVALSPPRSITTAQSEWFLFMDESDEQLEKRIATYLKKELGVTADYKYLDEDDLYLVYKLSPENVPTIPVIIDTLVSGTGETKSGTRIVARRVRLDAQYDLPEAARTTVMRAKLLEFNNKWQREKWVPDRVYLDDDWCLHLATNVNIPDPDIPVHAEMISDAVLRMNSVWKDYYKGISAFLP